MPRRDSLNLQKLLNNATFNSLHDGKDTDSDAEALRQNYPDRPRPCTVIIVASIVAMSFSRPPSKA